MRTLAAGLVFLLAACDVASTIDPPIPQAVRQSAIETCKAWIPQSRIAAAAGLDANRLCSCAADRILEGKGITDLPELRPDAPEIRAAIVKCISNDRESVSSADE